MQILLVDEADHDSRHLMSTLTREGFHAFRVSSQEAALAVFKDADIILLHHRTGRLDALEAIRAARRQTREPIIVLADQSTVDLLPAALRIGADDVITTPFDVNVLIDRIHALR